jgi:hypothetical protein
LVAAQVATAYGLGNRHADHGWFLKYHREDVNERDHEIMGVPEEFMPEKRAEYGPNVAAVALSTSAGNHDMVLKLRGSHL